MGLFSLAAGLVPFWRAARGHFGAPALNARAGPIKLCQYGANVPKWRAFPGIFLASLTKRESKAKMAQGEHKAKVLFWG